MRLSIVVPVLNEAPRIVTLLESLAPLLSQECELIVVDGGSDDQTLQLAAPLCSHALRVARGRASQMNAGAAVAQGEALLFLHADTRLPDDAPVLIREALAADHAWGRFDVTIEGRSRMLPIIAGLMNLRSRASGIATGDQAIFVRTAVFKQVGGFAAQPLMEDIELSRRLKRLTPPACLRAKVRTSGRRWEQHGVWRTILLMWRLRLQYWLGTPPETLARSYR